MSVAALECDIQDFLHQIRSDMSLLERKVDAGLKDDSEALIQRINEDIDCITRCVEKIVSEMMDQHVV